MDAVSYYAGIPQFMWENIFGLLNYLVPGVILALYAANFQNRRKREIKIEGKIALMRIDAYERVIGELYKAQDLLFPTLEEEEKANAILGYFESPTYRFQYPRMFGDEATFDAFYRQFQELQRSCQIYLDDPVSRRFDHSVGFFTTCKNLLDAYSDTERIVDFHFSEKQYRRHTDWVYKLCGMMMFSHCTQAYVELDNEMNWQLRHFTITYRRYGLRRFLGRVQDGLLFFFDRRREKSGLMGKVSRGVLFGSLNRDKKDYVSIMVELTEMMRYVHFSDKYSPREFFEGIRRPSQKDIDLYNMAFMSQVHRS